MGRFAAIVVLVGACGFSGPPGSVSPTDPDAAVDGTTADAQTDAPPEVLGPDDVVTPLDSCLEYRNANFELSGVYPIGTTEPYSAYCDMETDGGGWTLALKIDGTDSTFDYDGALWLDQNLLNTASADLTQDQAKLASTVRVGFDEMLVRFDSAVLVGTWPREATISVASPVANLMALMNNGSPPKMIADTNAWRAMSQGVDIQNNCELPGINHENGEFHRHRLGIDFNNENNCDSNDSGVGLGFSSDSLSQPAAGSQNVSQGNRMEVFAFLFLR